MAENSRDHIIQVTRHHLALYGAAGLSMRQVAKEAGLATSVVYHYFEDKDQLLRSVYEQTNRELGAARAVLMPAETARELLRQIIRFQLDHIEEVVAVLKYYLAYRRTFSRLRDGILPDKAYLHMTEVLHKLTQTGEFVVRDPIAASQVMTHAVNGFLLEYFPEKLTEADKVEVEDKIVTFLHSALKGGEL